MPYWTPVSEATESVIGQGNDSARVLIKKTLRTPRSCRFKVLTMLALNLDLLVGVNSVTMYVDESPRSGSFYSPSPVSESSSNVGRARFVRGSSALKPNFFSSTVSQSYTAEYTTPLSYSFFPTQI